MAQELERKQQFTGKVVKITLAGAVVDIGADKPGVVHISKLSKEPIKRVDDVVKVGDEVNVWISRVKEGSNHIEVTMIEPLAVEWREIKKGMTVKGTITRLEKYGAFIDIGAERPGLAHISELAHDYVRNAEDAVKIGDEVEALVLEFNRRKKQIKLSLKALQAPPVPEVEEIEFDDEDAEPALTAMEMAYKKAMGDIGDENADEDETETGITKVEREDILARTLASKPE